MIFGGYTKIRNRKNKAEKIKNLPPKIFYYKFIVLGSRPFENFNQLCFVLVGFSFLIEIPYLNGLNLKKVTYSIRAYNYQICIVSFLNYTEFINVISRFYTH